MTHLGEFFTLDGLRTLRSISGRLNEQATARAGRASGPRRASGARYGPGPGAPGMRTVSRIVGNGHDRANPGDSGTRRPAAELRGRDGRREYPASSLTRQHRTATDLQGYDRNVADLQVSPLPGRHRTAADLLGHDRNVASLSLS